MRWQNYNNGKYLTERIGGGGESGGGKEKQREEGEEDWVGVVNCVFGCVRGIGAYLAPNCFHCLTNTG